MCLARKIWFPPAECETMNKWSSSGRYGLTRGLQKRLWSLYNSFKESTGDEGKSRFLIRGFGSSGGGGGGDEFAYVLETENGEYLSDEVGILIKIE